MPQYINALIQSCYKHPCDINKDWFMVHNTKLNRWLSNKLGVYADAPTFDIHPYQAKFNWVSQTWMIR